MQIQITAVADPALIAAATRHGLRRPVLAARLAGWTVLLLAALSLAVTGDLSPALLTGGAVLAVLVPLILLNHTARGLRTEQVTTYEISTSGIASSDAESRHSYAWRAVRSVEHLSGQLLFRMRGARLLPVPTAGLSPAQIEQVLGAASANGLPVRRFAH
ncbi:YcxB family protein [Actinoplanes sp. NPDC023801]|uniref:YcxB family protein n=1 Tax=Actinoplanes sp. NPDC023801 TaxID=3154595 RepID=UPI0033DA2C8F